MGNYRPNSNPNAGAPKFRAVCDNCGKDCTVPFRPTGEKPVYCNDCFGQFKGDRYDSKPSENKFRGNDNFRGGNSNYRGNDNFRSNDRGGFNRGQENRGGNSGGGSNAMLLDKMSKITDKLDRILGLLIPRSSSDAEAPQAKSVAAEKPAKEAKAKKEVAAEKPAAKKAQKKPAAKKAAPKKTAKKK